MATASNQSTTSKCTWHTFCFVSFCIYFYSVFAFVSETRGLSSRGHRTHYRTRPVESMLTTARKSFAVIIQPSSIVQRVTPNDSSNVTRYGITQDAEGCRGACEVTPSCTSYTWVGDGGNCYGRNDSFWYPNATASNVVSGRPFSFPGDVRRRVSGIHHEYMHVCTHRHTRAHTGTGTMYSTVCPLGQTSAAFHIYADMCGHGNIPTNLFLRGLHEESRTHHHSQWQDLRPL